MRIAALVIGALLGAFSATTGRAQIEHRAPDDGPGAAALAAASDRLAKAIAHTVATSDTAFDATWGATPDGEEPDQANVAIVTFGQLPEGAASGSWHRDLACCRFDNDDHDEIVRAGRRAIARADDHPWALRAGRTASGAILGFLPDPELLLAQLAQTPLTIGHREVSSIDDRPVEILGARLQGDALAELIWSGALPAELESARIQIGRLIAGAAIRGAPAPKAEVDVAIAIDPGTSQVRRLHFRAYSDRPAAARGGAVGGVFVLQGGRIQAGGQIGAAADDDESDDIDFDVSAPLRYRDGLPQRSRKNKSVTDFVVTLRDHGSAIAPELDAAARQLLGR